MCLSKAYLESGGENVLLLEEVVSVDVSGDTLRLKTILGEEKEVSGSIREIDFLTHRIVLVGIAENSGSSEAG